MAGQLAQAFNCPAATADAINELLDVSGESHDSTVEMQQADHLSIGARQD
jgi:hypothetical protein